MNYGVLYGGKCIECVSINLEENRGGFEGILNHGGWFLGIHGRPREVPWSTIESMKAHRKCTTTNFSREVNITKNTQRLAVRHPMVSYKAHNSTSTADHDHERPHGRLWNHLYPL